MRPTMRRLTILWLMIAGCPVASAAQPLIQAHAHNDYHHPRPLLDALDHGFCSVEADVFLVDGQLLVGHTTLELKPQRTLQALYLDPIMPTRLAGIAEYVREIAIRPASFL